MTINEIFFMSIKADDWKSVAEKDNEIVSWAALIPVSGRCVYAGVAEVSVYVSNNHIGQKKQGT